VLPWGKRLTQHPDRAVGGARRILDPGVDRRQAREKMRGAEVEQRHIGEAGGVLGGARDQQPWRADEQHDGHGDTGLEPV